MRFRSSFQPLDSSLQPLVLAALVKGKNLERGRSARHHSGQQHLPASKVPVRRFTWKLSLLGLSIAAGVGCFAAWLWNHRGDAPASQPAPATSAQSNPTAAAPLARPTAQAPNVDPEFRARVNRGNKLLQDGKPSEALQLLTEAMKMNPQDEDVHYNLGLTLTRLGRIDEAVAQYEEALRIFPDYVEAHNNLGNLLMRTRRIEPAIAQFETAVKIMPDYASAHNNLGTALQQIGRTNDALLHFHRAATINPDYWEAHFNVAISCLQADLVSEARSELQTVLRLRPDFQPAKTALAEIEARQAAGTRVSH